MYWFIYVVHTLHEYSENSVSLLYIYETLM